jgi:hypothetical protein
VPCTTVATVIDAGHWELLTVGTLSAQGLVQVQLLNQAEKSVTVVTAQHTLLSGCGYLGLLHHNSQGLSSSVPPLAC